ncbi:MAG: CvpA family protein [Clostridia bacterium]|nr:CvpA family protein [Clostridia bacterium]
MMVFLDILFVVIGVVSILLGIKRGLIKSVIQMGKVLLSILLAFLVGSAIPASTVLGKVIGAVVVFVLAFIGLSIAAWFLTKLVDHIRLVALVNHLLGGVFGALSAAILLLLLSSVLKFFFGNFDFYRDTVIVQWFGDSSLLDVLGFLNVGKWFS